MRSSGILLAIFSLPSNYGIGCFSREAYEFVDQLQQAGQGYWQILPLGPTGYGDSPYQSFSTFAGNPYFIDLEQLITQGYLTKEECDEMDFGTQENVIDYEKLYQNRYPLLKKAFLRGQKEQEEKIQIFRKQQALWLEDYAAYMAVKNHFGGKALKEWPEEIRMRKEPAFSAMKQELASEMDFYIFLQYEFFRQWRALKEYANQKQIKIIGDIPIYVSEDSADAWANPELFQLDEQQRPIAVAGCPPDGFSATGQLWGNPLYRWDYHETTGFEWWMQRLAHSLQLYDVVRVDHFRGFDEYYGIPYGNQTAENGRWYPGPGMKLFQAVRKNLGDVAIIAEDLGYLTESVEKLVSNSGYPGMKLLEFAFDSREAGDYMPYSYTRNCVVYTGTHDNQTIQGWYQELLEEDRKKLLEYLDLQGNFSYLHWSMIRLALGTVADLSVIPMQDILGLGPEARINQPSTLGKNWVWRMKQGAFSEPVRAAMNRLTRLYGR